MATVYFDKQFAPLVDIFCKSKNETTKKQIFDKNYDFMIFAALIGQHYYDSCKDVNVEHGPNEIPDRIFYSNSKENVTYLLALHSEKSGDILKDKNDRDCWNYLERYASLGCEEIAKWISEKQDINMDINDVILNKIKEVAAENTENDSNSDEESEEDDIDF